MCRLDFFLLAFSRQGACPHICWRELVRPWGKLLCSNHARQPRALCTTQASMNLSSYFALLCPFTFSHLWLLVLLGNALKTAFLSISLFIPPHTTNQPWRQFARFSPTSSSVPRNISSVMPRRKCAFSTWVAFNVASFAGFVQAEPPLDFQASLAQARAAKQNGRPWKCTFSSILSDLEVHF